MTVLEPKYFLEGCYDGTDAIPLSQTAVFITKCLKWDLKDSQICLDLAYFRPKNKTQKNNSFEYLYIFLIDAENSFLKNASITHFKFEETRPRDNKII